MRFCFTLSEKILKKEVFYLEPSRKRKSDRHKKGVTVTMRALPIYCADMRFCFTLAKKILKKEGFFMQHHEKVAVLTPFPIPFH
jgi:hypothetical protein